MQNFPFAVEVSDPAQQQMADAILHELAGYLQALLDHNQVQTIDLNGLPIDDSGKQALRDALGAGEVEITLNTIGKSKIYETSFNGLWWVSHYDAEDKLVAEFIEVTWVPEIIKSHSTDVAQSVTRIHEFLETRE